MTFFGKLGTAIKKAFGGKQNSSDDQENTGSSNEEEANVGSAAKAPRKGSSSSQPSLPGGRPKKSSPIESYIDKECRFWSGTQPAQDVRDDSNVTLEMERMRWCSGGVFSNVYRYPFCFFFRGRLVKPEKMDIAIKKTWPKKDVRNEEMRILAELRKAQPRNIVQLLYKFKNRSPDDEQAVIRAGLDMTDVKIYTWQIFNGLDFLTSRSIAHRDLKPVNILVNHEIGLLQIADFGSAKIIHRGSKSTAYQVTRHYRPPEMLLGSREYTHRIDVWSAGCIMGEMLKGYELFPGRTQEDQLCLIIAALGVPSGRDKTRMRLPRDAKIPEGVKFRGIEHAQHLRDRNGRLHPRLGGDLAVAAATRVVAQILVYGPMMRACGPSLLTGLFFSSVLKEGTLRRNGQPTHDILQRQSSSAMLGGTNSEDSLSGI